jgi:hypothetical protein
MYDSITMSSSFLTQGLTIKPLRLHRDREKGWSIADLWKFATASANAMFPHSIPTLSGTVF